MKISIEEWHDEIVQKKAYYKDCEICDTNTISENYVLVTIQIPGPIGVMHDEIVPWSTEIEVEA